ncbi:hypothetical protein, partial [Planotetraspora mira]|uniref:hypothetical protein n=1 Tax=Planotetraspora mira TaxID=58121 RepID=UPI00366C06AD
MKKLVEIDGYELESLEREVLNNVDVKRLINRLLEINKVTKKDYKILDAKKWNNGSDNVNFLVLGLD